MSFFGFDTTLPGTGHGGQPSQGSSLDAKLAALGEDIQVYDFGGDAYAALETGADELNDETFGGGFEERSRDFDFVGSTAKLDLGASALPSKPAGSSSWLDVDPLLAPTRPAPSTSRGAPPPARAQQGATYKTLAEVEAELQAQRQQQQQQPRPPGPPQARSLAEIEAEMRAQQPQRPPPATQQVPPPQSFSTQQAGWPPGMPPPRMPPPPQQPPSFTQPPTINGQTIPDLSHMTPDQQRQVLFHFGPEQQHLIIAAQAYYRDRFARPPFPGMPPPPMQRPSSAQRGPAPPMDGRPPGMPLPPPPPTMFPALPGQPPQPSPLDALYQLRERAAAAPTVDPKAIEELEAAIRQHEAEEAKIKRRMKKIEAMAGDNGLMSRSDKDFITRIQVSQLVNTAGPQGSHDPYADDFYFHVYMAIRASRGGDAAAGPGRPHQPAGALASKQAMRRMAMQVQRIVEDHRNKPRTGQVSLDGALGKVVAKGRTAPRQALAVKPEEIAALSKKSDSLLNTSVSASGAVKPALTRRAALLAVEDLYGIILSIENLRRTAPQLASELDPSLRSVMAPVDPADAERFAALRKELWSGLRIMDPLDGRDPHPFISLLGPNKGKRLIPRVLRQTNDQESLTLLTLLVATFGTLDVVSRAAVLDETIAPGLGTERMRERSDVEAATEAFMSAVIPSAITLLSTLSIRIIAGLLGLLISRNDIAAVARSRPGVAFLTILLTRGGGLRQASAAVDKTDANEADAKDLQSWSHSFNMLFVQLGPHWNTLFPSTRAAARLPPGAGQLLLAGARPDIDAEDQAVWQLLAAVAVCADMQQQQGLVAEVREKVLENVFAAKRKTVAADVGERKIRNVDLLLNALGLSSSQIQLDE